MKVQFSNFVVVLLVFILCVFHYILAADEGCKSVSKCVCTLQNGSVIDLNSLSYHDGEARFPSLLYEDKERNTILINYNPCDGFTLGKGVIPPPRNSSTACINVYGCKVVESKTGSADTYQEAIAFTNSTDITMDPSHIIYKNINAVINVVLTCDPKATTPNVNVMSVENNTYNLNLTSKCACPNGCGSGATTSSPPPTSTGSSEITTSPSPPTKSGLSTGSILLIIFFTLLVVYIVGGMIWKVICLGATGLEILPNIEFWKDFPALITEGATFSVQCCMNRSTYDRV